MSRKKTENLQASDKSADFSQALAALRRGEVIVFPTETLYGLGADALSDAAVGLVFFLKGRDPDNPIPLLVADEQMLTGVVAEVSPSARRLMRRFWPGPLTLVLPARSGLPAPLLNRDGGVGVRISSQRIARQLVQELGRPLTATSANPSGKEPARTVQEAMSYFSGKIDRFLDGGSLSSRKGSSVVAVTGDTLQLIREGEISAAELEAALKEAV